MTIMIIHGGRSTGNFVVAKGMTKVMNAEVYVVQDMAAACTAYRQAEKEDKSPIFVCDYNFFFTAAELSLALDTKEPILAFVIYTAKEHVNCQGARSGTIPDSLEIWRNQFFDKKC